MNTIAVDTDFPAGNAIIESVSPDEVRLRQDQRGSTQRWFFWHFRVRGAARRTLRFTFTEWDIIGTRGPCVSRDGGQSYQWLGRGTVEGPSFRYSFAVDEAETYFCFCYPYTLRNLNAFLERYGDRPELRRELLCTTPKGRAADRLHIGRGPDRPKIVITARHHACESSASYCLEGLIADVLDGDPWLRENAEILIVPFVDYDGVEDGDQGKARNGRDHNRDYADTPRYAETAALRQLLPSWGKGKLRVALDLHCPWMRGPLNEMIYQVGSHHRHIWQDQQRFGVILQSAVGGELPYRAADDLPFGRDWNNHAQMIGNGMNFADFAARQPGVRLSSSMEIPYANVGAATTTPANLRRFGQELSTALRQYCQRWFAAQE